MYKRVKLTTPIIYNNENICSKTYHSASSTHNYVLNDPILDIFQYTNIYPNAKDQVEDKFLTVLFEQGNLFERGIMNILYNNPNLTIKTISHSRDESLMYSKYQETMIALQNNVPFLYQAPLHTQNPSFPYFGTSDIIAKVSELKKFIKKLDINSFYDDHYAIVDIKYSSVKFKADGEHILGSGRMKANNNQISIYNELLKQIPGIKVLDHSFILGRSYKLKDNIVYDCFYTLGHTEPVEKNYLLEIADWLTEVKSYNTTNMLRPVFPNMCNQYDMPYHTIKQSIAKKNDEITSLYRVSYSDRENLLKSGITKWSDPNFLLSLSSSKYHKSDLLKNIISVNMQDSSQNYKIDYPLLEQFQIINKNIGHYFVDIERSTNIILDTSKLPNTYKETCTFMIGVYSDNGYHSFLKQSSDEKDIYIQALKFIEQDSDRYGYSDYRIYHWGQIEKTYIEKALLRYDVSKLCDLYTTIISMNFVVKGSLSYGIKDIANAMLNNKMICYKPETVGITGQMAALLAEKYYSTSSNDVFTELQDIILYNKQDCKMLMCIFNFLMNIPYIKQTE